MSGVSENVRSHPIKLVTTTVCAIREPDAVDLSLEVFLLHWYFSRLTSSLSCSTWSPTSLWRLLSGFNDDLLLRDHRSEHLLELIEVLSNCCLPTQIGPLKSTMTDGVDLKSLGQFSSKRITIAQTVLKESSEGVITTTTSIQRYTKRRTTTAFIGGYCQSVDSFWHATCDCIFCIFCKHQAYQ